MNVILIVEDEFPNYLLIKGYLTEINAVTILAKNGMEAIDYVRNTPDISLVLMDLRMPEMDGFYAAKLISSLRPELPIIAQTAYYYDNIESKILDNGFVDYLRKPFSQNQLLKVIKKHLNEKE